MPRRVAFSNLYAPLQVPLVLIARSKVSPRPQIVLVLQNLQAQRAFLRTTMHQSIVGTLKIGYPCIQALSQDKN
jgi:hypothetical protein